MERAVYMNGMLFRFLRPERKFFDPFSEAILHKPGHIQSILSLWFFGVKDTPAGFTNSGACIYYILIY